MNKEMKKLAVLTDDELISAFHRAYKEYMHLLKKASLLDLHSIPNFATAKDELKNVTKELNKRRIVVKPK